MRKTGFQAQKTKKMSFFVCYNNCNIILRTNAVRRARQNGNSPWIVSGGFRMERTGSKVFR